MVVCKIFILGTPVLFIACILGPFRKSSHAHRNNTCVNYHNLSLILITPSIGNQFLHLCLLCFVLHKTNNAIDMEVIIG